ncbi:MAG: hypothetical protein JWQ25_445 [Daejeonella sp.]|nr:hypothetical protein [Daejeonella sp.]
MISEELNTLLRLVIAHLLTDFLLQPASWVNDRINQRIRSPKLYAHALVTAIVAYLFVGNLSYWWLPIVIFVTHLLIDLWKAYQPQQIKYFIADQLLHLLVITLIWLGLYNMWDDLGNWLLIISRNNTILAVLMGYIIASVPLGILIGIATEKWRVESEVNTDGLAKAGLWIGLLERFLIFTFIIINQYTAVGFLIAAKSILRFKETNTQKKTEYVLIGTLMSFSASVLLAVIIKAIINEN